MIGILQVIDTTTDVFPILYNMQALEGKKKAQTNKNMLAFNPRGKTRLLE